VVEKTEGSVVPFEEVRQDIERRLVQQRYEKEYDAYVEGLRKTATIDVRVREVPLQVAPPSPDGGAIRGDTLPEEVPEPSTAPKPGEPAGEGSEFQTTPQSRPERVVPPSAPGQPASPPSPAAPAPPGPRPSPTPSPTPPPGRS
jgi:hypothetical protein